jgi:hypothetical protein
METGMVIITAILFTIILVPIVLLILMTRKKSRTLLNGLKAAAAHANGNISEHTEVRNFAVGLDTNNRAFYFFKKTEEAEINQVVGLASVATCELEKRTKRIRADKHSYEIIESVALVFTNKQGHLIEKIEFYNDTDSIQLNGELVAAETYINKINALRSQPTVISEAKKAPQIAVAVA